MHRGCIGERFSLFTVKLASHTSASASSQAHLSGAGFWSCVHHSCDNMIAVTTVSVGQQPSYKNTDFCTLLFEAPV